MVIAMTLAVSLLAVPAKAGERLVAAPSDNSDFVRLPYDIAQTSSSCSVQGHWEKSKFIPSKDCQSELAHFFNFDGKADPNIPFTFAAMGDSTMYRLTNEIRRIVAAKCAGRYGAILKKSKGRCGIEKYLGVKDNCTGVNNFCLTNLRLFENEICYDCSGCDSTLWSSNGRGSRECTAEYVALMYADLLPPFPQEGLATLEGGNGTGRNIMYVGTRVRPMQLFPAQPQAIGVCNVHITRLRRLIGTTSLTQTVRLTTCVWSTKVDLLSINLSCQCSPHT